MRFDSIAHNFRSAIMTFWCGKEEMIGDDELSVREPGIKLKEVSLISLKFMLKANAIAETSYFPIFIYLDKRN